MAKKSNSKRKTRKGKIIRETRRKTDERKEGDEEIREAKVDETRRGKKER